jgi:hypothetical protein
MSCVNHHWSKIRPGEKRPVTREEDDEHQQDDNNNNNNVKTRVMPVIIGATGTNSNSFRKYMSTIPGNYEVRELKKKNCYIGHCTYTLESAHVKVH